MQDRIQTHMPSTNTKSIRISYFHRSQSKREREAKIMMKLTAKHIRGRQCLHMKMRRRWREWEKERDAICLIFFCFTLWNYYFIIIFLGIFLWKSEWERNFRSAWTLDVRERNFAQHKQAIEEKNRMNGRAREHRTSRHILILAKTHCKMIKGETATAAVTTVTKNVLRDDGQLKPMQCRKYQ